MTWSGTWHPLAERFPMLGEDELRDMAASIAERGQYVPCRMTPDGLGLDGRNRTAACALAGVQPRWEVYDGDPVAFIVEVNAERRHLSTGQRAIAVAIGLAEAGKRVNGRGGKREWEYGSVPKDGHTESRTWRDALARAGVVLDHANELANSVLADELALDAAFKEATARRDRSARLADLDEQLAALVAAGVIDLEDAEARVQAEARIAELPDDLAARVTGGALAVDEAETIAVKREQRLDVWANDVRRAMTVLAGLAGNPVPAGLADRLNADEREHLDALLAGALIDQEEAAHD